MEESPPDTSECVGQLLPLSRGGSKIFLMGGDSGKLLWYKGEIRFAKEKVIFLFV